MVKEIKPTKASTFLFILLCATIVLTAVAYGAVHQPIIAIFYATVVLIVIFWALDAYLSKALRFNKTLLQLPILAAFIYGIIQIIPFGNRAETAGLRGIPRTISLDPFLTQVSALHFLALFIFLAALLTYIDSAKRFRKMVGLIIIFGFIFAFFAILQAVLSPGKIYGLYETMSPFGSFVNRHNFAAYMEMTIFIPLGLMFAGAVSRDKRLLYVTAISLMGIALMLSGSRGGLVSLLAGIFFLVILTAKTKSNRQLFLKIGLSVLLIGIIIFGTILIGGESSLTRIAETASSNDITTNRLQIWSVTLDIISHNLPFGAGLGAFGVAYTPFDTMNGLHIVQQAHNDYLQVLADAGIIGLMIGGFFIYQLFRTGLKNINTLNTFRRGVAVGALSGCFAIFVHSLFDFVLHTTAISILFLTLVALVSVSGTKFIDDSEDNFYKKKRRKKSSASVTSIDEMRKKVELN